MFNHTFTRTATTGSQLSPFLGCNDFNVRLSQRHDVSSDGSRDDTAVVALTAVVCSTVIELAGLCGHMRLWYKPHPNPNRRGGDFGFLVEPPVEPNEEADFEEVFALAVHVFSRKRFSPMCCSVISVWAEPRLQ
jgi:hypothetical protein